LLITVSSAWLKVPRGELVVVWDLAAAINVGWWRIHGARTWAAAGIQVRMTGSEAG
jgi:hypothetical protein